MLRLLALFAASFSLTALTGCYREATDATVSTTAPRYTGSAPWTIDGVRPGQTFTEVKQLLGEPHETRENPGGRFVRWGPRDIAVFFDRTGHATEVMGSTVKAGTQTLVSAGANEAEVVQILGPGKVQKSSRPKGSGVISFGQEHIGTTLIYENGGVRFELPVFGEATGHFLARRSP